MKRVTAHTYVKANICNHGFVETSAGIVLVDTPADPSAALTWQREIAEHGTVRYLINTEPHMDHFGGNYFFGGEVVGHEGLRRAIAAASRDHMVQMLGSGPAESLPGAFAFRPPAITCSENLTLYVGDHTFQLFHLPGHTPFQTPVYVPEERVLFAGDDVVNGMPLFHQAVPQEWLNSLDVLMKLDVDVVVPGHGDVGDRDLIVRMKEAVVTCIDEMKQAIGKGMGLDEVLATVSFLDRYPEPGADEAKRAYFQRMSLTGLYNALSH